MTESKEITVVSESDTLKAIADYAGYAGEPDFHDAEPLRAPILRWSLAGTSTGTKEGGKYYNSLEGTDVAYDEVPCVFLDGKNSRSFYREAYDPKKPKSGADALPDCKSADAITGVGDPGGDCKTCPFSKWGASGGAPQCALSYDRLIFDFHTHQPGVISFARSKIKAIQGFQATIKALNGGLIPAWGYKATMRAERKDAYWVPKIEIIGLMARDEALFFKNLKTETNVSFMRATGEVVPVITSDDSATEDATVDAAAAY